MNTDTPKIIDAEFTEIISEKVDAITDKIVDEMQGPKEKPNRKQRRTTASVERRVISLTRASKKYHHVFTQRTIRRVAVQARHDASHARAVARKEAKVVNSTE